MNIKINAQPQVDQVDPHDRSVDQHNDDHSAHQMRRLPQQVRGQQRVESILAAAEQMLIEHGFAATTTNQIAVQAGVPIGSLYQFFPNKNAIVEELSRRHHAHLVTSLRQVITQVQQLTMAQAVDVLIDLTPASTIGHSRIVRMCMEATPGSVLYESASELRQEIFNVIEVLIRCFAPHLSEADCHLHAQIAQTSWQALLMLYVREVDGGQAEQAHRLLTQFKVLYTAYFRAILDA